MTLNDSASRPRLNALTGARGPAALMVFTQHAGEAGFCPLFYLSSIAVSFFFVLSGFVLAYVYAEKSDLGVRFYRARFARIWPATILSTLLVLLILPRNYYLPLHLPDWSTGWILLVVVLMLQSLVPIPDWYWAFNAVTWSISVEWCFYLAFPLLNRGIRSFTNVTWLLVAALGAILTYFAIQLQVPSFDATALSQPTWNGMVYINPASRLFEFVAGIFAGQLWLNPAWKIRLDSIFDRAKQISHSLGESCLEVFILIGLVSVLWLNPIYSLGSNIVPPLRLLLYQWFSSIVLVAIVLVFAACRGFVGKTILSHPAMIRLGELSFGVYLFHQPLLSWLRMQRNNPTLQSTLFEAIPDWCYFPVVLAVTLILSWLSHDWFETPARRLLKGR